MKGKAVIVVEEGEELVSQAATVQHLARATRAQAYLAARDESHAIGAIQNE